MYPGGTNGAYTEDVRAKRVINFLESKKLSTFDIRNRSRQSKYPPKLWYYLPVTVYFSLRSIEITGWYEWLHSWWFWEDHRLRLSFHHQYRTRWQDGDLVTDGCPAFARTKLFYLVGTQDNKISVTFLGEPEPTTMFFFGAGLAGLRVFRRKFRKA